MSNLKIDHPELIEEWHPDNPLMESFKSMSHKNVKWKCRRSPCECHVWNAVIQCRSYGNGCPYCNGKPCIHNNLKTQFPDLEDEWNNIANGEMENFSAHSSQKVKWVCSSNHCGCHEWDATIGSRTDKNKKCGCPYCAGMKTCDHNNLAVTNPELIDEWHSDNLPMNTFLSGSSKKVKWVCKNNHCGCHVWVAEIRARIHKNSGCPYCAGKICDHNNLAISYPELIDEWHPDNSSMNTFSSRSHKKVKWVCKNNPCGCHVWKSTISSRTDKNNPCGCPYCLGRKLCDHNNLAAKFPELAIKWHIDNPPIESFPRYSHEKVKWICSNNHQYERSVSNQIKYDHCPICRYCPSCGLWRTNGKLCAYCEPANKNNVYFKTKEMKVVNFMRGQLPDEEFIHNKSAGSECTGGHLFPDILFQKAYYNIIIEIDEFKHRGASYSCDEQRMYDIVAKLGLPCIFIRYNPDHKNSDMNELLITVRKYLDLQIEAAPIWNNFGLKCEYMYYD